MTLAEQVLQAAKAKGVMIATAESCTGGMVSAAITDVPGSSAVFDRGFVTYTNHAKFEMLKVSSSAIEKFGAVSEVTAREMATGALQHSRAQIAVALTGIAGPGGSEHKPEGLVWFGLAEDGQKSVGESVEFGALGRAQVRAAATEHALGMLLRALTSN